MSAVAAAAFAVDRVLRDGGSIHVRAIRADDKARLIDHFARLSARSVYFRFFRVKKRLTDDELRQFTELDFRRQVGLVATLRGDAGEQIVGVGRYAVLDAAPGQPRRAEVAFAIADDHQRRGIGAILLELLAEIARANGVEEFEADVLGENNSMLQVFLRSGFRVTRSLEEGVFHLSFPTEETAESIAVQQRRDRAAAAASVRAFLQPRAVAVVGASARPGALGGALVEQLRRGGFAGPIYPVHPSAEAVAGLPAFARVSAIGAPVDLAVVTVPAAAVEEVVADCARAGVHAVVVVSGGFAETGAAGRAAEQRLAALVRASGMRLLGPASMGVLNTDPAVALRATADVDGIAPGRVGLLAQSGAIGLALLERCARLGIGLSSFVSAGNKADVSGNDLLAYWSEDPRTAAVLLYLESFGNPRRFAQLAPAVARRKPIVAVNAGRGPAHLDVGVAALFEQAGVIRTDTLEGLFDVAALLASQPAPAGAHVGVVTNAAGLGALFAAAATADGLALPALSATARATCAAAAPAAALDNPLDLLATARPPDYVATLRALGADAAVDAVVAIFVSPRAAEAEAYAAAIAAGAADVPEHKPVLVVFLCGGRAPAVLHAGPRGRLPVYEFPESAAHALAAVARWQTWRQRPLGEVLELPPGAEEAIRAVVDRLRAGGRGAVAPTSVAALLRAAGIDHAMAETVPRRGRRGRRAPRLPLVMKAVAPRTSAAGAPPARCCWDCAPPRTSAAAWSTCAPASRA
ncbi:MAG: GNAT family N-acetyltransferase [Candidatus Binatia bacterium]